MLEGVEGWIVNVPLNANTPFNIVRCKWQESKDIKALHDIQVRLQLEFDFFLQSDSIDESNETAHGWFFWGTVNGKRLINMMAFKLIDSYVIFF